MMTHTIAQLWNGNLDPIAQVGRYNKEMRELEKLMQSNLDKLEEVLSEKATERFERYNDCIHEYMSLICQQAFCDGFCLGTRISSEALYHADHLIL